MSTKQFAQLGLNGKVINIIVVSDNNCQDTEGNYSETIGINFCTQLTGWAVWKGTHNVNGDCCVDGYYIEDGNYFKSNPPFPSWVFNTSTYEWDAPVEHPDINNEKGYKWNESTQSWDSV